jgi:hypothetical protein
VGKTKTSAGKTPAEQAVMKALKAKPQATTAEIASAAGVGRSTASKLLARLESSGEAQRTDGGRDGARRLPDRWALAATKPAAKAKATEPLTNGERLKPGQLDGLVLAYLKDNTDSAPHGPTAVARALQRSSGAVGNCLNPRLLLLKQVA